MTLRDALVEALQHDGQSPTVDCCHLSIYRSQYPDDWEERHRAQHVRHADAILAHPAMAAIAERVEVADQLAEAIRVYLIVRYRYVQQTGGGASDEDMDAASHGLLEAYRKARP